MGIIKPPTSWALMTRRDRKASRLVWWSKGTWCPSALAPWSPCFIFSTCAVHDQVQTPALAPGEMLCKHSAASAFGYSGFIFVCLLNSVQWIITGDNYMPSLGCGFNAVENVGEIGNMGLPRAAWGCDLWKSCFKRSQCLFAISGCYRKMRLCSWCSEWFPTLSPCPHKGQHEQKKAVSPEPHAKERRCRRGPWQDPRVHG